MLEILNEASTYKKKYKCPFCEFRADRKKLVYHIDRKHENLIPEDSSALRMVFNIVNKKDHGTCIICKKESPWNEQNGRYDRICQNPACMKAYKEMVDKRMIATYGVSKFASIPEYQERMLAGRKISGTYKWSDGTEKEYTGSFERNALEFLDNILECHSWDITTPGPIINYEYNGETHFYISDIYYIPYNLIIEVKDGGDNPNMREMRTYREKQLAKEKQIIKDKKYNYLRLTNNNFSQLLEIFAELKMAMQDANDEKIIRIHEHMAAFANGMLPVEKKQRLYLAPYMMNNVFAGACLSLGPTCDQLIAINTDSHFLEQQQASFLTDKQYKLYEIDDACKEGIIKEVYKAYTEQREVENDYLMKVVSDHTHKGVFLKETITSDDRYNFVVESTIANILQNQIFFESITNLNNDNTEYAIQEDCNGYFALYKDGTRTASIESVDLLKEYLNETRYYNSDTIISEENIMNENKIFNQKDLYYNKEKFDNGEINLCFITGFSGSGKSTMGKSMSGDKVEHYELDDVIWNKEKFSMENFKEYGDLIYSFFAEEGSKYYYTADDIKQGKAKSIGDNYEENLINDFINYSIKYAKSHKDTKFILEGVWLYLFITPTKIADYAVYIKGTSALVSAYRGYKRNVKNDKANGDKVGFKSKIHMMKSQYNSTFKDNSKLKSFRNFFYKRIPVSTDTPKDTNKIPVNEVHYYDTPLAYNLLPEHLKNDPVHSWRAKKGIELIHQEPTLKELKRIWANWQSMPDDMKSISDKKSMELFGMNNEDHYKELIKAYNESSVKTEEKMFDVFHSDLDKDFKPKEKRSLSEFKKQKITRSLVDKYKDDGALIKYMVNFDQYDEEECYIWIDKDGNYVCFITYDKTPKNDGYKWITGLDVAYKYRGCGLTKQLVDLAVKDGVTALDVQKDNKVAIKAYTNYGFKITDKSKEDVKSGKAVNYIMLLGDPEPINESKSNHFKSIEDILKYISSNYRNMKYNEIQDTVDKLSDHLDSYGPSINATLYLAVPIKNDKEDRSNTCPFFIYSKDDDKYWFDLKHNRSSNKSFKGQTDAFEDYAKTIFKSRSVVVGYSIDDYSDKDAYEFESSSLNEITETKNRFDLDDEEEKYIQSIQDFCNELKKYKYGIIIDGKIKQNPSEKDFWNNYKTLTISEFEKYKCGTCYDYVAYQMDYFKKHFPEAKCKAYYLTYINEHGDFSHTFMTFEYHGYWFWFEAAWKSQAGVDQIAKNEKEILDNICLNHQYEHEKYLVNKKSEKILKQYNPLSMQGLTLEEFSKRVNPNCEKLWTKYGLNESAILNENFLDAINMSKDQKEFLSQFTTILSITDWVRSKIRYAESNQLRDYNEIMMERCANDVSISHFIKTLVSKSSATVDTSKVITVFGSKQDEKFVSRMDDKLTHTVYVYSKNEKYYWFESKIYDKRGVHGPFISYFKLKEELGQMVMDEYNCKTVSILTNASSISTNKDLTKDEYLYAEFESGLKHAAIDESATSKSQLYFVSTKNLDKKVLAPRIPSNYFTRNNFEENTTPRVCLSTSIEGACIGLSRAIEGTKLYVHTPVNEVNYYTPTIEEVPDRKFSHEVWVKEPVRMKYIGQIKITETTKSHKFAYGKIHEGELWERSYEWIKRNT